MDTRSFVHSLQRRAGDGLRAVGGYDEAKGGLAYYRNDLDPAETNGTLREVHRNVTQAETSESRVERRLGSEHASLQLQENGVVMRISKAEVHGGAIASFGRGITRDLGVFAEKCFRRSYPERTT